MNTKDIIIGTDARDLIINGVDKLANAVKATLGPKGRNALIRKDFGAPHITKDGVTVARAITLKNPFEDMGAQLVKEVSSRTNEVAGDGTTTATVLAQAILKEGIKAVTAGRNPMDLKRGIDLAVEHVTEYLGNIAFSIDNTEGLVMVGTISANADKVIGEMIAKAITEVGKDGAITVKEGSTGETTLSIVEGTRWDRGYMSNQFVTNKLRMVGEYNEPLIMLIDEPVNSIRTILPALEIAERASRPIVIVAEDFSDEVISVLALNSSQGTIKVCAVKAHGFGDRRTANLEDLAVLVNTVVYSEVRGVHTSTVRLNHLGTCERVICTKDSTTIVNGNGSHELINERIESLRQQLSEATNNYDKGQLTERINKMSGKVAQIIVGATTEVALKEKKDRVDDALNAVRAAAQEGVVAGGGVALVRAAAVYKGMKGDNDDQTTGISIVIKAIEAPLRQIVTNAGNEPSVVINKVALGETTFGYNAASGEYGDMFKMGILDPVKVTRTALENAASIAGLMLTTEVLIADSLIDIE